MSKRAQAAEPSRGEPVIVFRIGPQRFVMSSAEVEEIRDLHAGVVPAAALTRGVGKQVPVVCGDLVFGLQSPVRQQLLILAKRGVAVAVDRIERMGELREMVALPPGFHGEERSWYRGLALLDGSILPVVDAAVFQRHAPDLAARITAPAAARANSGL